MNALTPDDGPSGRPPERASEASAGVDRTQGTIVFGEFRMDLATRSLARGNRRLKLQRKPFDVLAYLLQATPRLVTREELLERFWSRAVNEESLTRCVSTLRKRLGDLGDPPVFIETHRGVGYRFIAPVELLTESAGANRTEPGTRRHSLSGAGLKAVALAAAAVAALALWSVSRDSPNGEVESDRTGLIKRIAVLPIRPEPGGEAWLAPALTEHLMQAVSRIEGVAVVASGLEPGSAMPVDPQAMGRRLQVEAVLASTIESSGGKPELRSRLIATSDGRLLWSFSVESEEQLPEYERIERLARAVATRLRPSLQLQKTPQLVADEAYRHYLQGRYYLSQRSLTSLEAALDAFDRALAIEPDYVDALVGAAESWLLMPLYGAMAPTEATPEARARARAALGIDASNPRARAVLGVIAMQYEWDWPRAESRLREAVTLNPNDATARQWLGELYCYRLRTDDCRREIDLARELDPLSPVLRMLQGSPALWRGDYATAAHEYARAVAENPAYALGHYTLGLAFVGLEQWEPAIAAYRSAEPGLGLAIVGGPLIYALAKSGQGDTARALLGELHALADVRYVPPTKFAVAYWGLGQRDRAMDWLGRAVESRDDRLVYLIVDVHLRAMRDDPAFQEIAATIGLKDLLDSI